MQQEVIRHFSRHLEREMEMMVYGSGGIPFLAFPTQNSKCRNYEEFGMIRELSDFLEQGLVQFFVVDTVDEESWSLMEGDKTLRADRQEAYFHYIIEEALCEIRKRNGEIPAVTGFSMGANHAVITFLRRPDLFRGVIALSGVYDSDYFYQGWMNPVLYESSPERFLPNMPSDHPYIRMYNDRQIILCCGQGPWEEDGIRTIRNMDRLFKEKGIRAWCDLWGYDVAHDWPWWYKQMRYFLPFIIEGRILA